MTPFVFSCLMHFAWISHLSSAEFLQESNTVYTVYGLSELARDILERIKLATGQPINTNRFFPILAASYKDYDVVEHQPYTKKARYHKSSKNNKLDGGHYHIKTGNDKAGRGKDHFFEVGKQEAKGNELEMHNYEDESGKQKKYDEEGFFFKDHHNSNAGKKGKKFKKGRKHGKYNIEKGFRDIYHKDEEKKSDFYWNNQHEEGKWIEYGFKNRKTHKSKDKGGKGKEENRKTEESNYEKEKKCIKCKT